MHGGLSTGPKTLRGKLKALQNLRQYRDLPAQGVYDVVDLSKGRGTHRPPVGPINRGDEAGHVHPKGIL